MSGIIDTIVTILLFIIVLGGLVLAHEFGHFVIARLARVRVLEFGVGFPPRAKVLARGGETLYTLNWLPIGGFVKLEDEDGGDSGDPRSFGRARLPIKLLILVAGVAINLVLSFAIFTAMAWFATPYVGLRFDSVEAGSPAEAAGLRDGDAIVSLDGERYDFFSSYDGTSIISDLRARAGEPVTIGLVRADDTRDVVTATLRTQAQIDAGEGALGIRAGENGFASIFLQEYTGRPIGTAASIGAEETVRWFGLILGGLGDLVGGIVADPTAAPGVSGPVGIATSLGGVFRDSGPIMTLYVAGILSANLALVNVLPFPPLDGGRMLMLVLKALPGGRRISIRAERLTYGIGFMVLFAFLIWVTVFDVIRQVGGGTP
jgi:regulator of sigma E protease